MLFFSQWQIRWLCLTSALWRYGEEAGREDLCRWICIYIFKNWVFEACTLLLWPPQSEYVSDTYDSVALVIWVCCVESLGLTVSSGWTYDFGLFICWHSICRTPSLSGWACKCRSPSLGWSLSPKLFVGFRFLECKCMHQMIAAVRTNMTPITITMPGTTMPAMAPAACLPVTGSAYIIERRYSSKWRIALYACANRGKNLVCLSISWSVSLAKWNC